MKPLIDPSIKLDLRSKKRCSTADNNTVASSRSCFAIGSELRSHTTKLSSILPDMSNVYLDWEIRHESPTRYGATQDWGITRFKTCNKQQQNAGSRFYYQNKIMMHDRETKIDQFQKRCRNHKGRDYFPTMWMTHSSSPFRNLPRLLSLPPLRSQGVLWAAV